MKDPFPQLIEWCKMSSTDPLHFTHPFPYSEFVFKWNQFLKVEQTNKNIPILLADFLKNLNVHQSSSNMFKNITHMCQWTLLTCQICCKENVCYSYMLRSICCRDEVVYNTHCVLTKLYKCSTVLFEREIKEKTGVKR